MARFFFEEVLIAEMLIKTRHLNPQDADDRDKVDEALERFIADAALAQIVDGDA